jgi:hypothetical protein
VTLPGVKVGPESGAYLMAPLCSEVVPFGLRVPLRFPARAGNGRSEPLVLLGKSRRMNESRPLVGRLTFPGCKPGRAAAGVC